MAGAALFYWGAAVFRPSFGYFNGLTVPGGSSPSRAPSPTCATHPAFGDALVFATYVSAKPNIRAQYSVAVFPVYFPYYSKEQHMIFLAFCDNGGSPSFFPPRRRSGVMFVTLRAYQEMSLL